MLEDGFALDNDIVLAYVIEDRVKSGHIANHLNGRNLRVQYGDGNEQVFTLQVLHPVYTRMARTPQ